MPRVNIFEKQTIRETKDSFALSGKLPDGSAYQLVRQNNEGVFYGKRADYLAFKTLDVIGLGIGTAVCATAGYFAVKHGLDAYVLLQSVDASVVDEGVWHGMRGLTYALWTCGGVLITRGLTGLRHGGLAREMSTGSAVTLYSMAQLGASYPNPK